MQEAIGECVNGDKARVVFDSKDANERESYEAPTQYHKPVVGTLIRVFRDHDECLVDGRQQRGQQHDFVVRLCSSVKPVFVLAVNFSVAEIEKYTYLHY